MRILINHSSDDKPFIPGLIPLLKSYEITGAATSRNLGINPLQDLAKKAGAEAILLSNPDTLKALAGEKATLDKYRGSRFNYEIPVIVVNPLAHIHSVPYGKWLLQQDLKKFKRVKEKPQDFSFTVADTPERRVFCRKKLEKALLISFDVETDDTLQITCISFVALLQDKSVFSCVIPLIDFDKVHYDDPAHLGEAIKLMRYIMALPIAKVAFNGIYDSQYCIRYRAYPENWIFDTMILSWARYSELPRSLDFVASINCYDYIYWKSEADKAKSDKDIRSYWAYCVKDSWYTLRALLEMFTDLQPYQIHNYQRTFRYVYPSLYCAYEGFAVDEEAREKASAEAQKKLDEALLDLQKITCNPTFNPGSYKQVGHFIYDVVGGKKPERLSSGGTGEATLNRVAMQHPLLARIIDLILTCRAEAKAISTYYNFKLINGRMLYNIDPSGTDTARFASKASNFWVGAQIQNIPYYAKIFLVADPGFILIERDNNKSEARCVAYLSRCEALIKALEDLEKDFYKICATNFFGVPYDEVTPELRNEVTKRIIHGTNYVMGAETFIDAASPKRMYQAMAIVKTEIRNLVQFAKYLLGLYHKAYPEVSKVYYKELKDTISITGELVSPLGWTRKFFGDPNKSHAVFRSAVAHAPQNLSVDIINDDFYRAYKEIVIPSNGEFRLKAQIHDSILAQAREDKAMYYAKKLNDIKPGTILVHGRAMILPTDTKMGKVWKDMKPVTFEN